MAKQNVEVLAFNRGVVSPLAEARVDIPRVAMSASEQENWFPKTLGPMSLRPGRKQVGRTRNPTAGVTDSYARFIPFIFSSSDTALLELTDSAVRVWVNDTLVSYPATGTQTLNGTFPTNITNWTDVSDVGGSIAWNTGPLATGCLTLTGDGRNAGSARQLVQPLVVDRNKLHALKVVVQEGDVYLRVGSTAGGQEYVSDTLLRVGEHNITFTPTGDFYVQVYNIDAYAAYVDSITINANTVLELAAPWSTQAQIDSVRYDQSGDVIFLAADGVKPKRIERRSTYSWSIIDYVTYDGPFNVANTGPTTLTPSATSGAVTLTASRPIFKSTHVGALFKLVTQGQNAAGSLTASDTYTPSIRVFGTGVSRAFTRVVSTGWTGTLTLQKSLDNAVWEDVSSVTSGTVSYNDGLDNQTIYYRIGFKPAAYTSGTAVISLYYGNGTTTGMVRIRAYTSASQVQGSVVVGPLGGTAATTDWSEGAWSDYRGYPTAVALHEGRLWWAGKTRLWGSVVDSYHSFNEDYVGDAGPINRSLGTGPVDKVRWMLSAHRLLIGTDGAEWSARSSSLDEPLTPTNFNLKASSTRGSGAVAGCVVNQDVLFVDRSQAKVHELAPDGAGNYTATELTMLSPEITTSGIVRTAVQRLPDTRVHCVRTDGKVAVLVYDKAENVKAWVTVKAGATPGFGSGYGLVEDVVVLPTSSGEDAVYYVTKYSIGGETKRVLERWALESECTGGTLNKQADAFVQVTNAPASATLSGLSFFVNTTGANIPVCVWADGKDYGTFTPAEDGTVTLPTAVSSAIVGLPYTARFRSSKLAHAAQGGTALVQPKRVDHLGLILANTHYQGLKYGPDFDNLDDLPLVEDGVATAADTIWSSFDKDAIEFPGTYDTDSRVCLQAQSPRPCTVLAIVVGMKTNEKL